MTLFMSVFNYCDCLSRAWLLFDWYVHMIHRRRCWNNATALLVLDFISFDNLLDQPDDACNDVTYTLRGHRSLIFTSVKCVCLRQNITSHLSFQ